MTKSNHTPLLVKDGTHLCEKSSPGFIHVIGEAVSLDEFDEIDIHNHKQGQTTFLQMACPIQLSKEEWIALIVHRVNNWDKLVEALGAAHDLAIIGRDAIKFEVKNGVQGTLYNRNDVDDAEQYLEEIEDALDLAKEGSK